MDILETSVRGCFHFVFRSFRFIMEISRRKEIPLDSPFGKEKEIRSINPL